MNDWFSLHTHSRFSANDAMPDVLDMVARADALGYPALGLTDHGTMSGSVQLYKACRKTGIEPMPGQEFYITPDREHRQQSNYHITIASYSEHGYRNLVGLHNMAQSNFFYRPRIDLADIAGLATEGRLGGIVASSGCYFGLVTQTLLHRGPAAAQRLVEALAGWFPRFYVELHNHEVNHPDGLSDLEIIHQLVSIADASGIPYIIAQDSHYLTPDQQGLHDSLKTLVSFSEDPSEAVFPGGPYSMFGYEDLVPLYPPKILAQAVANLGDLAERAHLRLPELEEFSMRVPDVTLTGDADAELRQRCEANLDNLVPAKQMPVYLKRFYSELEIVRQSGFADYLILVAFICDHMVEHGIWFQTRGSASGSLICYLLGITQLDPVVYDLQMDRFMSTNRMKPPDIDLDVEHLRRDEVVAFLGSKWSVRQIGSHMKYSVMSNDVEDPEMEESTGSLVVKFLSTARKRGSDIRKWADISQRDKATLTSLGSMKLIAQAGTHAAGYLVSPDAKAAEEVPLTWIASRKAMVTAYAMKDVETLGFTKIDLLGLRTMTAIKLTMEALK